MQTKLGAHCCLMFVCFRNGFRSPFLCDSFVVKSISLTYISLLPPHLPPFLCVLSSQRRLAPGRAFHTGEQPRLVPGRHFRGENTLRNDILRYLYGVAVGEWRVEVGICHTSYFKCQAPIWSPFG